MTCGGCENAVKRTLMKLDGVQEVSASHAEAAVVVRRDPEKVTVDTLRRHIEALGYRVTGNHDGEGQDRSCGLRPRG
jgi:copper chaperone CopZ